MTKFQISYTREFTKVIKKYKKIVSANNRQEAEWAFNRWDSEHRYYSDITDIKELKEKKHET